MRRLAWRPDAGGVALSLRRVMRRMMTAAGLLALLGPLMNSLQPPGTPGPEQVARQLHRQLPVSLVDGIDRVAVRPAGERAFILHYTLAPGMDWAADAEQFVQAWQPRLDREFCESPLFAPVRQRRSSVS